MVLSLGGPPPKWGSAPPDRHPGWRRPECLVRPAHSALVAGARHRPARLPRQLPHRPLVGVHRRLRPRRRPGVPRRRRVERCVGAAPGHRFAGRQCRLHPAGALRSVEGAGRGRPHHPAQVEPGLERGDELVRLVAARGAGGHDPRWSDTNQSRERDALGRYIKTLRIKVADATQPAQDRHDWASGSARERATTRPSESRGSSATPSTISPAGCSTPAS